jgi:serpin B
MKTQLSSVLFLSLAACGGSVTAPPEARSALPQDVAPAISGSDYSALVAGDNAFAADLYGQISSDETQNLFFSPNSISVALGMTYAGANGDTATQMADTLHFTLPAATVHAGFDKLALDLATRGQHATSGVLPFALHEMDSLWAQNGFPFEQPFLDTLSTDYNAGIYQLDFTGDPEGSRGTINDWVADQTDQKIHDLMGEGTVTPDTRLVLTNAIYFEAAWKTPFDTNNTAPGSFTTASGTQVTVDTMHSEGTLPYASGSDFQAVELPYDGDDIAMDVLLPTGTDAASLAAFEGSLTGDRLTSILGSLASDQVLLSLPKVQFTGSLALADTLKAMGMTDAFDPGTADFSGMTTADQLFIATVSHKGFISITEKGTVAAAATSVGLSGGAAPVGDEFNANHPYLIIIRDLPTGAILFMGRVSDPTQTGQ